MSDTLLQPDHPAAAIPAEAPTARPAEDRPDVSVVLPLFNEADCIERMLQSLAELETLLSGEHRCEFVLVDDGSSDATAKLIERSIRGLPAYRLVRHAKNRGIAAAISTGLREARAPIAASIDADGSYDLSLLAEMIPLTGPDCPLVTASPYHRLGGVVGVPAWRIGLSRLASRLYALLMPRPLDCYTSCFRTYDRLSALQCEPFHDGFTGVAELAWKMQRRGGLVLEHPAVLRSRVAGVSKMRVCRTIVAHAGLMCRIAVCGVVDRLAGRVAS